jgi:hypothetical protein
MEMRRGPNTIGFGEFASMVSTAPPFLRVVTKDRWRFPRKILVLISPEGCDAISVLARTD